MVKPRKTKQVASFSLFLTLDPSLFSPPFHLLLACSPSAIAVTAFGILLFLFALVYSASDSEDALFYVFVVLSFVSGISAVIVLEEDGYISNFLEGYMRQGEPYLSTAHGMMNCYWAATTHFALQLAMIAAITQRKSFRNLGLYWVGSLTMNFSVYLLGNVVGKYGSEIRPDFFLNIPLLLALIWAASRIFAQPKTLSLETADKVSEEQRKSLLQRPLDLVLVGFLLFNVSFTLFRGLVVLDCKADVCFDYINQQEPYLRDPVAYPKIQMLVFLFYGLPYFCLCLYGLLTPGSSWMPDWALISAGAIAQAQFSHIGSSLHQHTPFPYRTPESAWWLVTLFNLAYAVGPHLLVYRCLRNPAFFSPVVSQDDIKKKQ
uniref:Transmembrane 6 superfamily member 2 n=1 Tax=Podarcis muralis TaxID=64176 RepID=A0A670K9F5_PODMU